MTSPIYDILTGIACMDECPKLAKGFYFNQNFPSKTKLPGKFFLIILERNLNSEPSFKTKLEVLNL